MDSWADETPLYIWSGNVKADLAPLKAAKVRLEHERDHPGGIQDLPTVRPIGVTKAEDLPTLEARVLAIGTHPPFLCDYFLIDPVAGREEWVEAFCWVTRIAERNDKATTILDILASVFGPGVREIPQEDLDAEIRLRDYLRGL